MSVDKKYSFGQTFSAFNTPSRYCRVYSKNYEKALALEFELDRSRDIIMKLKNDLSKKNKEIHLLKINKITIEEEHYKTVKTLREFLKRSDNLTKATFKTIEKNINENNNKDIGSPELESEKEENFPNIKRRVKLQNKNKRKIKDFIKIDSLKQHIYNLNEELTKKNNLIKELKNNKKATGYKELQNNFLSSCNEIKEMKKENMEIKSHINDVTNLLIMERDDNKNLKNKLQQFKQRFEIFKELSIQKVKKLDDELNIAKEKERNYNIKKNGEKSKEKYNDYIKTLEYDEMKRKINEYQMNLKKNNDIIKKYKITNFINKEENKKLMNEQNDLIYENETLKKENEEMKKLLIEYKKKVKYYEKEEKIWKEENSELKKEIAKIQKNKKHNNDENNDEDNENKNKIFFTDIKDKHNNNNNKIDENLEIKNEEKKSIDMNLQKKDNDNIGLNENKKIIEENSDYKEKKENNNKDENGIIHEKKEEIKKEESVSKIEDKKENTNDGNKTSNQNEFIKKEENKKQIEKKEDDKNTKEENKNIKEEKNITENNKIDEIEKRDEIIENTKDEKIEKKKDEIIDNKKDESIENKKEENNDKNYINNNQEEDENDEYNDDEFL